MTQNIAVDVDQQWPTAEAGGAMRAAAVREGEDRDLMMTVTSDHGMHLTDLETVIQTVKSQFATTGRTATVIEAIDQTAAVGAGLPLGLTTETVTANVIAQIGTGIETGTGIGTEGQTETETVYEMTGIEMMTAVGTEVAIVVGIDRPMIVIAGDTATILAHRHVRAHPIGTEIVTGYEKGKETGISQENERGTGKEIGFEIGTDRETEREIEIVNGSESATGIGHLRETERENETETGLAIVTVIVIGQRRTTIASETVTVTATEIEIAAGTGKENPLLHRAVVPVLDGTLQACSTSTATSHLPAIEAVLRVDGSGPQSALRSGLVASLR